MSSANFDITDYEQWHAWRIGRDCKSEHYSLEDAIKHLKNTFPQSDFEPYFHAGFSGKECPELSAKQAE